MKLSRRSFIKSCIAGATAALVPAPVEALAEKINYPHFNPTYIYGNYVAVPDERTKEIVQEVVTLLIEQIEYVIPQAYHGEIQFFHQERVSTTGQYGAIGWKYTPEGKE